MLKWRDRVGFKVYMKNKPVKHGIKSYVLADSKSVYCWNMSMYTKDNNTLLETIDKLLTPQYCGLNHCLLDLVRIMKSFQITPERGLSGRKFSAENEYRL